MTRRMPAATFRRASALQVLGEEAFQAYDEERAEAALRPIGGM